MIPEKLDIVCKRRDDEWILFLVMMMVCLLNTVSLR